MCIRDRLHPGPETKRFEFFGHGIVELARLTTGKSTQEISGIAEILIRSGYDSKDVESFLSPLTSVRSSDRGDSGRRYHASLDVHGELVNEGIVVALPFLEELEVELELETLAVVASDDLQWLLFPIDPGMPDTLFVGLRYLGVARLKGLPSQELAEAAVWTELPPDAEIIPFDRPLIDRLRRFVLPGDAQRPESESDTAPTINNDLLVITYVLEDGSRKWIFGQYRDSDGVILHALQVPIQTPDLTSGEPLEMWLFKNRFELAQVYEGLRRESPGISTPLSTLRSRPGYLACFLAAPHRLAVDALEHIAKLHPGPRRRRVLSDRNHYHFLPDIP